MATSCSIEVTKCDDNDDTSTAYTDANSVLKDQDKRKNKNFFLKLPTLFSAKDKKMSTSKSCDRLSDKPQNKNNSRSRSTLHSKESTPEDGSHANSIDLAKSTSISSFFNFNLFKRSKNLYSSANNITSIPGSLTLAENTKCLGFDSVCF